MEIATAQHVCRGETECGDSFVILESETTTIALVDGLGHGPKAKVAADAFCNFVRENPSRHLEDLLQQGSTHIARTRGVAVALLRIRATDNRVSFSGIGNVELHSLSREPIKPVSIPGIVGRRLRKTKQFDYTLQPDDLLVLYTDGISSRFDIKDYRHLPPAEMANTILENHGKYHDDATCIVIRY